MTVLGAYPAPLRSVLKAAPCIIMAMTASYVFWIAQYAYMRHTHDHVPKFTFKSTKFGLYCRQRDDRLRDTYQQFLYWNPNESTLPGCWGKQMR